MWFGGYLVHVFVVHDNVLIAAVKQSIKANAYMAYAS